MSLRVNKYKMLCILDRNSKAVECNNWAGAAISRTRTPTASGLRR